MPRLLVVLVPGLSPEFAERLSLRGEHTPLPPVFPALTIPTQATITTGVPPRQHGMLANGIATYRSPADAEETDPSHLASYRRAVSFWEQSNTLLEAPRFWHDKPWRTACICLQHTMPGFGPSQRPAADMVVTPKPRHGPDGSITSLLWTEPAGLADELQAKLGPFPLHHYWGPLASLPSSRWITSAAVHIWQQHRPDLLWAYLPHLDYDLQRFGPGSEQAAKALSDLGPLLAELYDAAEQTVVIGEYGIDPVTHAIAPNRALRDAGLLQIHDLPDGPSIDYRASDAWVMCDHQIGHVYIRSQAEEVERVLAEAGVKVLREGLVSHRRAGDRMIQAPPSAWLDYRWWTRDADAPAWSRTVDIHRKPGYDPLELFFDPATRSITADSARVRGSHGRVSNSPGVLVTPTLFPAAHKATDIAGLVTELLSP